MHELSDTLGRWHQQQFLLIKYFTVIANATLGTELGSSRLG